MVFGWRILEGKVWVSSFCRGVETRYKPLLGHFCACRAGKNKKNKAYF